MAAITLLWASALWLYGACATPSVPVPPPEPESMVFAVQAAASTATFSYDPEPSYGGAIVYVFNRSVGVGIIATAESDGSVGETEPFAATVGDEVVVTFEFAEQLASTCVALTDGRSSSANECR